MLPADGTASGASRAARGRVSDAEPEALAAGEVGGDHQRAAVALEAASDRAHADRAVPRVEQVRAVLGAGEPHVHYRACARENADAPCEVLANARCLDAGSADAGRERPVEELAGAEHRRRVAARGPPAAGVEAPGREPR